MRSLTTILITAILLFTGCTPISTQKSKPIKELLVKEMSVDQRTGEKDTEEIQELTGKHMVRVGLMEHQAKLMFSFNGLYSISDGKKTIFSKKESAGDWRVYADGDLIVMQNPETGDVIKIKDKIILKPLQIACFFKAGKFRNDKGWQWKNTYPGTYKGSIEFINLNGKITVVNEVGLEQYVYGVVPSEMGSSFPPEALKAQAVLARTNAYRKIGKSYKGRLFSISDDIYSQVYSGISKVDKITSKAVDDTRNEILTYNGKPVEALFHSTCGGHTEGNDNVYLTGRLPYLQPEYDTDGHRGNFGDLSSETRFRKWLASRPDCYCSPSRYFRWERKLSRKEIEKYIKSVTGRNVATLKDLKVTERGVSGKAVKVRATGTSGSIDITKELTIRKALRDSNGALYSGNISIDKYGTNKNGVPSHFIIKGAGYGHGLGMCQYGAAGLANSGKDYKEILKFYLPGTKITAVSGK